MKKFSKARIRIGKAGLAFGLVFASVSVLPMATADTDDVVQNISTLSNQKPGEITAGSCDSTASNVDKRGKLVYEASTGGLKYVDSADSAD
jgi:hypothetical protein